MGYLPGESSQLLFGMVFGGTSRLSKELEHSFKVTGMLHVLSASGYNVGLMIGLANLSGRRFCGRRTASIFSMMVIFVYVCLAEGTASVIRAGIMGALQIIANQWFQRSHHAFRLLGLTCCVMLTLRPDYSNSLSFQLSVLACLGILFWAWVFQHQDLFDYSSGLAFPGTTI